MINPLLTTFLTNNSHQFISCRYESSLSSDVYLDYSIANYHHRPCEKYVLQNLNPEELVKKIHSFGLPVPFYLDYFKSQLIELFKYKEVPQYFADQYLFTDWTKQLLCDLFSFDVIETSTYEIKHVTLPEKGKVQLVLTPYECDLVEIYCLIMEVKYQRMDSLSILDDSDIKKILNLYLFLKDRTRLFYLIEVLQECIDRPLTSGYVNEVCHYLIGDDNFANIIEHDRIELNWLKDILCLYKQSPSIESLYSYVTSFCHQQFSHNHRIELLKKALKYSEYQVTLSKPLFEHIIINNALKPITVDKTNILISSEVDLHDINIKTKTVKVIHGVLGGFSVF
jgi:hypothetical protein